MGTQDVHTDASDDAKRRFARAVLEDIRALERLCADGMIESGIRRVGAEQEMFLVDERGSPAPIAVELLSRLGDPSLATELDELQRDILCEQIDSLTRMIQRAHKLLIGVARRRLGGCC